MSPTSTYRRPKPAERRAQILDGATELSAERGYDDILIEGHRLAYPAAPAVQLRTVVAVQVVSSFRR